MTTTGAANGPAPTRQAGLQRATAIMSAGTLASRDGLARLVVAAYALGVNHLSDAFNLANNTPNIVHDLVLGGILAATFVPVFVDRLANNDRRSAEASISAVVTLGAIVLIAATVLFVLVAPAIIDLYTLGGTAGGGAAERAVATRLLQFFAPQLACYGAISLMTAVLNAERRFTAVAWVPVLNNLVAISVLAVFAKVARATSLAAVQHDEHLMLLLGLGTTAGVAIQALALVPSMRRSGIRLHFSWRPRQTPVRTILSLSGWTFGFVVANQIAVFVVLALAVHLGQGDVTAYTYAFTFFQLPFGTAAVSVMSAFTPELARDHAVGDRALMRTHFGAAMRQMLAIIIPATVGYLVLAQPIVDLLARHGAASAGGAKTIASVLVFFSLGLPGYCVYLLTVRAFQAMQDTRTAFVLYALENGVNVLGALLLERVLGVRGLALSLSIAYTLGGIVALGLLRARIGGIGGRRLAQSVLRALVLSVAMAFAVSLAAAVVGTASGVGLVARVFVSVAVGVGVYVTGAGLAASASAWQTARRRAARQGGNGPHRGGDRQRQ